MMAIKRYLLCVRWQAYRTQTLLEISRPYRRHVADSRIRKLLLAGHRRSKKCEITVVWDVIPCSLVEAYQHFGGRIEFLYPNEGYSKSIRNVVCLSRLTALSPSLSRLSRKCGSLVVSQKGSRGSPVSVATGYGLDDRGAGVRVPLGSRISSSPRRSDRFWGHTVSYPMVSAGKAAVASS
jgi:hypothetical protein